MCDNDRQYTPYPRNDDRITQLEELILKQRNDIGTKRNSIETKRNSIETK